MERRIIEGLLIGKSANELSRELHVCKKRIKRLREDAERAGYFSGVPLPAFPAALFPEAVDGRTVKQSEPDQILLSQTEWIKDRLETGWHPITVYEELPVSVSRSSFYRFLDRHELRNVGRGLRRVIPEIVHKPGEALQLDWGKLRTVTENGRTRTLWVFAAVLGFSRLRMARLVWSNDVSTTMAAIQSMFEELGGVPIKITSDNPKCFSLTANRYEPLLNPAYERFAAHYRTVVECLPPRAPTKKGKIERQIPYLRRLYEAHGDAWHGIEESQAYLNRKLAIANARKHGTTRQQPATVFEEIEKTALKSLPPLPYEVEEFHSGVVRRDGHVRFRNKYYSVEDCFIAQEVIVLGGREQISIFHKGKLIEVHARVTDPHVSKSTKPHHLKPWLQALDDDSLLRVRARRLGPAVEEMVTRIVAPGLGFIDYRKVWGILSLDKKYSAERINNACEQALSLNRIGYQAVRTFLEQIFPNGQCPPLPEKERRAAANNKFLHSIEEYKEHVRLTVVKGGKHESRNDQNSASRLENAHCGEGAG